MATELLFGNSFETQFKVPDLIPFIISANEKSSTSDRLLFIEKAKLSFDFFETQLKTLDPILKSQSFKISWKDDDGSTYPCLSGSELRGMILADIQTNKKKHRFCISLADKPALFPSSGDISTNQKRPKNSSSSAKRKLAQDSDDEEQPNKSKPSKSKENNKKKPQPKLKPAEKSKSEQETSTASTSEVPPLVDEEKQDPPKKRQKVVFSEEATVIDEVPVIKPDEELPVIPSVQVNPPLHSTDYDPFAYLTDPEKQELINELEKNNWDDGVINHFVFVIGRWKWFVSSNKHLLTRDYYIPGSLRNASDLVEGIHYRKNLTLEEFIQWLRQLLNLPPKKYPRH